MVFKRRLCLLLQSIVEREKNEIVDKKKKSTGVCSIITNRRQIYQNVDINRVEENERESCKKSVKVESEEESEEESEDFKKKKKRVDEEK